MLLQYNILLRPLLTKDQKISTTTATETLTLGELQAIYVALIELDIIFRSDNIDWDTESLGMVKKKSSKQELQMLCSCQSGLHMDVGGNGWDTDYALFGSASLWKKLCTLRVSNPAMACDP